jgi:hypothetical protein
MADEETVMTFSRCKVCCMPPRPDTDWVDGICTACLSYGRRPTIDWGDRGNELRALLARHSMRCIVPSSGGKDSTAQVLALLEMNADVTVVTASTCHLTPIGRRNIDNLARYARTIEVTPNRKVRATLNCLGLQLVGDISWPEHVSIFTTPFRMASQLRIPLIFYGENPQNQYGGPLGADEARRMTRRWVSEFGGFLGLRPGDLIGKHGLSEEDMSDYLLPSNVEQIEAHFLGQYLPWDSYENARVAERAGMEQSLPCEANLWPFENLDNAQTGIHDHLMYRKYGYGRGCAQAAVDVRTGRMSRDQALAWVRTHDGRFPYTYAGVSVHTMLEHIGMGWKDFNDLLDKFTNWDLFSGTVDRRPILKEFA